jgi:hypothetical protein
MATIKGEKTNAVVANSHRLFMSNLSIGRTTGDFSSKQTLSL